MWFFMRIKIWQTLRKLKKTKDVVVGVPNLTPTSSSSNRATNREEVQDENLGDNPIVVDGDVPVGADGDDAQDIEDVEQGEQPVPPEIEKPQVRRSTRKRLDIPLLSIFCLLMRGCQNAFKK